MKEWARASIFSIIVDLGIEINCLIWISKQWRRLSHYLKGKKLITEWAKTIKSWRKDHANTRNGPITKNKKIAFSSYTYFFITIITIDVVLMPKTPISILKPLNIESIKHNTPFFITHFYVKHVIKHLVSISIARSFVTGESLMPNMERKPVSSPVKLYQYHFYVIP